MHNSNAPSGMELPSSRDLLRWTGIAGAIAALLLVTVVLPAEYAIDPTGVGRVLGLTQMGEVKMALAEEAALDAAADAAAAPIESVAPSDVAPGSADSVPAVAPAASHVTRVDLEPGQGREIKLVMQEGAQVDFEWTVEGGVVNYDLHADRPGVSYHGYSKGTALSGDQGTLIAAFDGKHGWFWRNRGSVAVVVTLRTTGDYSDLQEVK